MTNTENQHPQERIADDKADDVLALAAKYYAEQQDSYSEKELIQAGSEVNIPPELIQKAMHEIEVRQRQASLIQLERKESRRLLIGLGVGVLTIAAGSVMGVYNTVLLASARVDAAWAQVENQMQRRADLLPTLLLIAQATHQRNPALVEALQGATQSTKAAHTAQQKLVASQQVDAAVTAFTTAHLSSSDPGARQDLVAIQYEVAGTANRLAVERMRFNQAVDAYNRTISLFPMSLVANAMGRKKEAFMQPIPLSEAEAPSGSLSGSGSP